MIRKKFCLAVSLVMMFVWAVHCQTLSISYEKVNPGEIKDRLSRYKGADAERGATLAQLFEDVGCKGRYLQIRPVADADAPNVICTLPGETGDIIIVGAHFDRVDTGDGVADNWSGASLLPSLYQSLQSQKRRHTLVFIGFSDEEEGFVGSRAFVRYMKKENIQEVKAMINLDTLGLGPTEVWASNSNATLVNWFFKVASSVDLPASIFNVDPYGDSDGSSFIRVGIPVITLHTINRDNIAILHSEKDAFAAIDLEDYYDSYRLIATYLAALDQLADGLERSEEPAATQ
ncbi:MAG: M28 family peptidase [Acidobacteriota bacterium]